MWLYILSHFSSNYSQVWWALQHAGTFLSWPSWMQQFPAGNYHYCLHQKSPWTQYTLRIMPFFHRCVPSPTLTVEESQHWRNLSYACHIQVVTTWLTPSKQSSHKWVSSNLRTWKLTTTVAKFGYTLAPLQDDHICICLHSCLCRTSILAFLPLQDEQGVNSSCSHWQFDKTHFSSTIKWSFIS